MSAPQLLDALAGGERHIAGAERLPPRSRGHLQRALLERGELLTLQADGEDLGDVERAVFEAERGALRVLV